MEGLTLTRRPAIARDRSLDADTIARVVFALLCLAFAVGFFVYPTYPNYDSYYSLLWGRDLLDLQVPNFEGFRVPTEHPLAIAAGAVLSLFGAAGDRLFIAVILASFLWLIWGVYRLGRVAFTPLVGGVAALLVLTRFDFGFLAARGYIDIPYMALVVWAAVLEADRPRRGVPVLVVLAAAGMLRPEAWVLAGLYWLWMAWRASWRERIMYAALAAIGPLVWTLVDLAVTGNPLFSLLYTSGSAEDLGRQRTLSQLPTAIPGFFNILVKLPLMIAATIGFGIALVMAPRRMAMPFVLLASGIGTFVLIGIAGASVIERYLAVAAVALLVFAAVFFAGFTMLRPSRVRTVWMAGSAAVIVFGVIFTATQVRLDYFDSELTFRGAAHDDLVRVLESRAVQDGLRCGPLTVPNHKLVPDARWILDAPESRVIPRADRKARKPARGVALVVVSRFAVFKHAWSNDSDSPLIQSPPAGWRRVVSGDFYAAYARC
jgi:MFS family permease